MKTLEEVRKEINTLAEFIDAKQSDLPTYGKSRDFGYPHIEIEDKQYHYVVVERGQELDRKSTKSIDELMYWVFEDVTHSMAFDYELKNRVEDQDCRRIAFPKQIELMGVLGAEFKERIKQHINSVLKVSPYDDEPTKRVNRMRHG